LRHDEEDLRAAGQAQGVVRVPRLQEGGRAARQLAAWAKEVGWEKLANTRGPTWKKIPDSHKTGLFEAKALALLENNPSAIRRPIVEAGDRLLVGFDPGQFEKL
jgi:arsenate reductase (glutaredoxin)